MAIQKENLSENLDTCFVAFGQVVFAAALFSTTFLNTLWTINAKSFWGWSPLSTTNYYITKLKKKNPPNCVLSSDLVWILNWTEQNKTKLKGCANSETLSFFFGVFLGELTSWKHFLFYNWFELLAIRRYRAIMPGSACFVLFWRQKEKQVTKHAWQGWFLARERVIALAHTHRVIPFLSALILPGPLPWAWVGGYLFLLFLAGTKAI